MFNSVGRLGGYCILLVWVAVLIGLWQLRYCFFSGVICFGLCGATWYVVFWLWLCFACRLTCYLIVVVACLLLPIYWLVF